MKRFYTILGCATLAINAYAQQVPDADFDFEWTEKAPWTSKGNEKTMIGPDGAWTVSNVIGINGTGKTTVACDTTGMNDSGAVYLFNSPNSILKTQIVPGYMTLGTTWSTSVLGSKNDGGVFGGIEFTYRPDALSFYYKRTHGVPAEDADESVLKTYNAEEKATVLAYIWKGTWTQKEVPGSIEMFGTPKTVDMVNRERNILGIETALGGEVTKTDDAELIAVLNTEITEDATEWTRFEQPLEYKSDAAPEMINIILAANELFGEASAVGRGNDLTVDNLSLVYYSRLKSLKVGDNVIALEDGKYDYAVSYAAPSTTEEISYEVLGQSATEQVSLDVAAAKATITVSNVDEDSDGLKEHTYTISFGTSSTESDKYKGKVTIVMAEEWLTPEEGQDAMVEIIPANENSCTFVLPNFALGELEIGDIVVPEVTITSIDGVNHYKGAVKDLSLLDEVIHADVDLSGTIDADGKAHMDVNVLWKEQNTPIVVEFNGTLYKGSDINNTLDTQNVPVEYYNLSGVRVSNPQNGIFIRRQGDKATKVVIK